MSSLEIDQSTANPSWGGRARTCPGRQNRFDPSVRRTRKRRKDGFLRAPVPCDVRFSDPARHARARRRADLFTILCTQVRSMQHKKEILARALAMTGVGPLLRRLRPWNGLLVLNYHRIGEGGKSPLDSGVFSAS